MASSPIDLPVLISALPNIQKVANAEQMKPEAQRDLFSPYILAETRKQEKDVQNVQPKEETEVVSREQGGRNGPQGQMRQRKKKEEEEEQTAASNASPWTGNILNLKI